MNVAADPRRSSVPTRMHAAVLAAPGELRFEEVPVPRPGPAQVLVRVEGSGLCGSNLPPFQGRPWFRYPMAAGSPGHEGWGRVVETGAEVRVVRPGDRVAMLSGAAFAAYDVADAGSVLRLPAELAGRPFPGEPLACAFNVFRRAGIREGDTVAVLGVGFLGAVLTQLAAEAGAAVLAVARRPFAREFALSLGAREALPFDHGLVLDHVRARTNGRLCDVVVECVGEQGPLDLAGELVRERGRLVIAGYHQDGRRSVELQQWNWRGLDVINAHEREPAVYLEGMRLAAEAVAAGRLPLERLLTHTLPLSRLSEAARLLQERPDGFLKVVVTP